MCVDSEKDMISKYVGIPRVFHGEVVRCKTLFRFKEKRNRICQYARRDEIYYCIHGMGVFIFTIFYDLNDEYKIYLGGESVETYFINHRKENKNPCQ